MAEERKVLLKLRDLKMHFPLKREDMFQRERKYVHAVDGVSIDIYEGETLGLVGESGCGKSTLGRLLLQLYTQTSGSVHYGAETINGRLPKYLEKKGASAADEGIDLSKLTQEEMRVLRRELQMVFQDPYSSLNPRLTVGQLIAEALVAHNMYRRGTKQMEQYTLEIMDECGLQAYMLHRYPHQFSGGQRQRIGIARSLALKPKFVVCDEAVSALDVSIQSQIINLLMDLKELEGLTYLFISHDLSAVKFISDRIGVMYLGNIIELADSEMIFSEPVHPYTKALIDAIPTTEDEANRELKVIEGDIPSPIDPPPGCKFHTRCQYATDRCKQEIPEWREHRKGHFAACHFPLL